MHSKNWNEMSPEEQLRAVAEVADAIWEEKDFVTLPDITNRLGISNEAALEYMNKLVESGEWESPKAWGKSLQHASRQATIMDSPP